MVRGSAWRAAIWTSRRSTPASSMVVTNVCLSICGCGLVIRIPEASASRRRRRVAACRSMRTPRLLRRMGPLARPPTALSMARPTAGGSGISATLVPLPHTQHPVAVLFAKVGDICAGGFEDPQAQQSEHRDEREVAERRRLAGRGEQSLELQVREAQGG